MLAAAKNDDVICLQMKNRLARQESVVQKETVRFLDNVKDIISSGAPLQSKLDKFIPEVFNFRLLALKWLAQQPDADYHRFRDEVIPALERLKKNSGLALLAENCLFAMRCNSRVVTHMAEGDDINSEQLPQELAAAPYTTYQQFFSALALSIPDERVFQIIGDFSHASLYIEFILVAALLIDEENMQVSAETVSELAFLVADAAQNYFAIATQMGIISARTKTKPANRFFAAPQTEEDRFLSDLGIAEFALNF